MTDGEITVDQFWGMIVHKNDQYLQAVVESIEKDGVDTFCGMLADHVLPHLVEEDEEVSVERAVYGMALLGAVTAMIAWREKEEG